MKTEATNWLMNRRYDDDMINGNLKRIENNKIIDYLLELISLQVSVTKPREIIDYDCPGGVCGTGGRE
jgi:hypothetical protein